MANDTIPARRGRKPRALTAEPATAPVRRRRAPAAALEGVIVGKATTVTAAHAEPMPTPKDTRPTITWRGRTMPVQMPTADQLAVVMDTFDELANLSDRDAATAEQSSSRAGLLLTRALKGTLIVLADHDDRDWIKGRMLDGDVTLNDVGGLLPEAIAVLNPQPQAPTTGPAPKARRR